MKHTEMQEYDLHHRKPFLALFMKNLTPRVWRFQGSDKVFFTQYMEISVCVTGNWKMLARCTPETCWLQPQSPVKENNPYQGLVVSGLLCRVTGRSLESPRVLLLPMARLCARPRTCALFWGHPLNPRDSSGWRHSLSHLLRHSLWVHDSCSWGKRCWRCTLAAGDPWGS